MPLKKHPSPLKGEKIICFIQLHFSKESDHFTNSKVSRKKTPLLKLADIHCYISTAQAQSVRNVIQSVHIFLSNISDLGSHVFFLGSSCIKEYCQIRRTKGLVQQILVVSVIASQPDGEQFNFNSCSNFKMLGHKIGMFLLFTYKNENTCKTFEYQHLSLSLPLFSCFLFLLLFVEKNEGPQQWKQGKGKKSSRLIIPICFVLSFCRGIWRT